MSKYTGKSDFGDIVEIHYSSKDVFNGTVYINNSKIDFENSEANLILYYPYLISSMSSIKNKDKSHKITIYLTNESYIDTREKEILFEYYLTLKDFWQNKIKYNNNLYNNKIFKKYNTFLDVEKMQEIVFKLSTTMQDLKSIMLSTKLKKSYNYNVEKMLSDKVMEGFHLKYYQDRRKELIKDFEEKGGDLQNPLVRSLLL